MNNTDINIDNYESFAMDYLEGQLTATDAQSFELFLTLYPDIAEEMDGLLTYSLAPTTLSFDKKESLLKKDKKLIVLRPLFAIAASLLLILSVGFLIHGISDEDLNSIASPVIPSEPIEDDSIELDSNEQEIASTSINNEKSQLAKNSVEKEIEQVKVQFITSLEKEKTTEVKPPELVHESSTSIASIDLTTSTNEDKNDISPINEPIPLPSNKNDSPSESTTVDATEIATSDLHTEESDKVSDLESEQDKNLTLPIRTSIIADEIALQQAPSEIVPSDPSIPSTKEEVIADDETRVTMETVLTDDQANTIADNTEVIENINLIAENNSIDNSNDNAVELLVVSDQSHQNSRRKKRKFSFRNFIPESLARISKDDIKRALTPETIASR